MVSQGKIVPNATISGKPSRVFRSVFLWKTDEKNLVVYVENPRLGILKHFTGGIIWVENKSGNVNVYYYVCALLIIQDA